MHGDTPWVATLWRLRRFQNALAQVGRKRGFDRWYGPQLAYATGDIDVHDMAVHAEGEPVFVSTLFSCVARPDPRVGFQPIWKPPFISRCDAEGRCQLNGLAMRDGKPAFATCIGRSDANEGWREHRAGGGLRLDIASGEIACEGLPMPHSPRCCRDRPWLVDAGTGEFGWVDLARRRCEPVAVRPGFLRGLAFVGGYAVVVLSMQRENRTFRDLALDRRLAQEGVAARCAPQVIDHERGGAADELRIEGALTGLFDVAVLPGARNPGAVGFRNDEIRRTVVLPPGLR